MLFVARIAFRAIIRAMTTKRPRGRPPKFDNPADPQHLAHALQYSRCGFAEACRKARTTPHLVKQMMRASAEVEFELRVACLRPPHKKRLGERWGRPEIVLEAALEAHRREHGERGRTWEEVQESIRRRAEGPGFDGQGFERALVETVTIPEAETAEDECF